MKKILFIIMVAFLGMLTATNLKAAETNYINLNQFPETTGNILTSVLGQSEDIGVVNFEQKKAGLNTYFEITMNYKGQAYKATTNLPYSNRVLATKFSGYYYSMNINHKLNRFLYYEIKSDNYQESYHVAAATEEAFKTKELNPFNTRVIWNITSGEHELRDKVNIFGSVRKNSKEYYLDFVVDTPTDKILVIELSYRWNNIHWFGIKGQEFEKNLTYIYNNRVLKWGSSGMPEFIDNEQYDEAKKQELLSLYNQKQRLSIAATAGGHYTETDDRIQQVDSLDVNPIYAINYKTGINEVDNMVNNIAKPAPTKVRDEFITRLNKASKEAIEYYQDKYMSFADKPILLKYNELKDTQGGFTASDVFTAQTKNIIYSLPLKRQSGNFVLGTEFKDIAMTNIVYQFNGKTVHLSKNQITSLIVDDVQSTWVDKVEGFFKRIGAFFKKYLWLFLTIGTVVFGGFVFVKIYPILKFKKTTKGNKRRRK